MSEPSVLRVGVVGAGANTRKFHIPGLQKQPGVEVVAVANRSRESGERAAGEFGIPRVADHWLEIVEDDGIDAVCIGTCTHRSPSPRWRPASTCSARRGWR